ncbi:MAG TPA: hypothetical protein DC049_17015 [Spirochaetia bacterium]|nr:hypothetical protein [Spirochaetia bacterium]
MLSIINAGAVPVLADIDEKNHSISAQSVIPKITPATKAVMPVHIYGNMQNITEIESLCRERKLFLIEDACQAFGAKIEKRRAGTIGVAGAFSFYPTKNIGCYGDGGMIAVNDQQLYEKMKALRDYGQTKKYHHDYPGINSRLDEMQAAFLRVKLKYLEKNNKIRIETARCYNEKIRSFIKPVFNDNGSHVYHLYVLMSDKREAVMQSLKSRGISSLIHYPLPGHQQKAVNFNCRLPQAEQFSKECFSIPMHPYLKEDDIKKTIDALNGI